ncbi:MAG: YraN family protein [Deltaproteobacteria bacterium]|nr:YraN family protein [Deltaproteobacteria bacterium]
MLDPRGRNEAGIARDPRAARGRAAEDAACALLVREGYRVLERNVRLAGAEIDVIARDGEVVVFVEVRSRSSRRHGGPLETIGATKRVRIARAASAWLAARQRRGGRYPPARFDVVGVDWKEGIPLCTLVRNAFESPL